MSRTSRIFRHLLLASLAAGLVACGGSGTDDGVTSASVLVQSSDTAADGLDFFNAQRMAIGLPELARDPRLDEAAQGHSDYQALNAVVSHYQVEGKPGFTGVCLGYKAADDRCVPGEPTRLEAAGYVFTHPGSYAYGEVISKTAGTSGADAADALIAAIYHRFVIFEPMFRDAGVGAASAGAMTYFTTNFATDGLVPVLGKGNFIVYPRDRQVNVRRSFRSNQERPDPWPCPQDATGKCTGPDPDEVGYPISIHADATSVIEVDSFTLRPVGGSSVEVRNLWRAVDPATSTRSAAAIVPRLVLAPNTQYEARFSGRVDGIAVTNHSWTFTTGP